MLVSSERSGTNYFLTCYRKVFKDDLILGEVFREKGDSLPAIADLLGIGEAEVLNMSRTEAVELWSLIEERAEAAGYGVAAKIFYQHKPQGHRLWEFFRDRNKVVHLVRRNQFDVLVSLEVAKATGVWQIRNKDQEPNSDIKVTIDLGAAEKFIENKRKNVEFIRSFYSDSDYVELFYEDISSSHEVGRRKVADIYGVADLPAINQFAIKKQNLVSHELRVENYEEVRHLDKPTF